MHASVRPYVSAGVALVGASVISVTPIAPSQPDIPDIGVASAAVHLAAASIANVPANLINAIANIPAYEIQALQRLTEALNFGGSWWLYTANNLLGWGPADPAQFKATVDVMVPFPAVSVPLGEQLNMILAANLPEYAGCTGLPPCPDPLGMLSRMFRVPLWDLISGYTFPTVINPLTGTEEAWSGQTVYLDPLAPIRSVIDYLMAPPSGITTVSPQTVITTVTNLFAALDVAFNPFIPDSYCLICQPGGLEKFLKSLLPSSATSIPSPTPDAGQTVTLDAAALRVSGGDVQQGEGLGNQVGSLDGEQDGVAVADIASTLDVPGGDVRQYEVSGNKVGPDAQQGGVAVADVASTPGSTAGDVLTRVQDEVAAGAAASGLDTAIEATNPSTAATVPSTDLTKDGNKFAPGGQSGPKHRMPGGGLAGAVKSVQETVNASIPKITDGLKGGHTNTGDSGTGDTAN